VVKETTKFLVACRIVFDSELLELPVVGFEGHGKCVGADVDAGENGLHGLPLLRYAAFRVPLPCAIAYRSCGCRLSGLGYSTAWAKRAGDPSNAQALGFRQLRSPRKVLRSVRRGLIRNVSQHTRQTREA